MPNDLFRDKIRASVQAALRQYKDATRLDHPELVGRIREIAVRSVVEPLLYEHLAAGRGKITDCLGALSSETDCVIYSTRHLPAIMYAEKLGAFPVDAVFAAIEIKSCLSSTGIRDAYEKAVSIWRLRYSTGRYEERGGERIDLLSPLVPAVFAFSTDLSATGKSELERYLEVDSEGGTTPTVSMICVVGRGLWWYRRRHLGQTGAWIFHEATADLDEVIDFMAILSSFMVAIAQARVAPTLEPYLVNLEIGEDGRAKRR